MDRRSNDALGYSQLLSDVYLTQCGWEACARGHQYGPAVRNHVLIHYIAKGRGCFYKQGEQRPLAAREGFVIFPGETTTYIADEDDPWTYYWVGFSGAGAQGLLAEAGVSPQNPFFRLAEEPGEVCACLENVYTNAMLGGGGPLRALGQLFRFLSMLVDAGGPKALRPAAGQVDYTSAAIRYIQEHYANDLTVDSLSNHIGIDRSHLFRVFKARLGMGPQQYIVAFRVSQARRLLAETDMPLHRVAEATGFSSPTHMGVAFRRENGTTPGEYRRRVVLRLAAEAKSANRP